MNYKIVYSKRRSIAIVVSPDSGVIVRAPYRTSQKNIDRFVQNKSSWIKKHLNEQAHLEKLTIKFSDGMTVLFHGKKYTLNIITSEKNQVTVNERIISVGLKRYSDERKGEQFFKDWLRYEATLSIKGRLNEILARFDNYRFAPSAIQVKNMKRRWGSCSSGGKITINAELIKLDDIFTEYVILHELCHLYYHNHGKEYYRLLAEVFPDWKAIRKRLRLYHA